ncbi:MAG: cytochrome P450 [Myxococcales bacterium]|nr:cytochrome P450 [Myxococcales bacterium]
MSALPCPSTHAIKLLTAFSRDPLQALTDIHAECGDISRIDAIPMMPSIAIYHPDDVHQVLVRDFRSYRKDLFTRQLRDTLGDGLLTAEGARWRRHRRLAQPGFHARAIRGYAEVMVSEAQAWSSSWSEPTQVDAHEQMMRLTLQIVARTLFGQGIEDDAPRVSRALSTVMEVHLGVAGLGFKLPTWLPVPSNRRHARAVRELDDVLYRMIREHRQTEDERTTLLGMLLAATDAQGGFTDTDLRDEALTLLMAGHETTAMVLTMALYLLSQHPGAEARLQAEVDAAPDPLSLEDLSGLPFTRAVILETMRLYPPAWAFARESLVDTAIGEAPVPRGTQVWISPWVIHRDARWFEHPLVFRPQRWLSGELEASLPHCAYVPFSAGPRVCIGKRFAELEAISVLATLARKLAFRLAPGATLDLVPSITLRPRAGLPMGITPR